MDSSSIISFNNDSTYQTTLKVDSNNVSVHELALHAMRDRCLLLQRRINTLETDNMRLKLDMTKTGEKTPYTPLSEDEKLSLQQKIAELNKQKSTLLHHVFMVSCENKTLWNKLSTLKSVGKASKVRDHTKQPLIRTNTYIHSTPKYNAQNEKFSDSSLEEISLKLINSYIQEKSQLVEQYEQMTQLQDIDDVLNVDSIGFTYIEDPVTDSLKEIHTQTEKLQNLKKELSEQEKNLKIVISRVEALITNGYRCPTCEANKEKPIKLEHKETETSDSLITSDIQLESSAYNNDCHINMYGQLANRKNTEQESNSEPFDKMCPICGEKFKKNVAFTDFQSHVENHFISNNEIDSIDNFDTLPNSLDNVI